MAIHEAGHAVAAHVLGIAVTHVTMVPLAAPGAEAAAETRSAAWLAGNADLPGYLAAIETDIKISLAGPYGCGPGSHGQHEPLGSAL
jgi:hypothetical protein